MTKTVAVLWLTLLATLAASWTHLVQVYARQEWPDWWPVACLAATAIDLGILVSLMAVSDLAADGQDTSGAKHTAYGLTALSSLANVQHVIMVGRSGSGLELGLAIVTAAALPLIVWRLSLLLDALRRPLANPVTASGQQTYTAPVDAPVVLAKGSASAAGRVAKPLANGHDALAKYLATVASVGHDDAVVANALGVSERTVRRYRAMASNGQAEGAT